MIDADALVEAVNPRLAVAGFEARFVNPATLDQIETLRSLVGPLPSQLEDFYLTAGGLAMRVRPDLTDDKAEALDMDGEV